MCEDDNEDFDNMLIPNNSPFNDQQGMVGMLCFVSSSNKDATNNKKNKRKR